MAHEWCPGDGERPRVEQVRHLAQRGKQLASAQEIVYQMPARGLQIDEQRHVRADGVEIVETELDLEPWITTARRACVAGVMAGAQVAVSAERAARR